MRPLGSHRRASMSSGSGRWTRRGTTITGTRKLVSVHMSFLLVLGDGLRGEVEARVVLASAVFSLIQFVVGDMEWLAYSGCWWRTWCVRGPCSLWSSLSLSGERSRCASFSCFGRPCDHTAHVLAVH